MEKKRIKSSGEKEGICPKCGSQRVMDLATLNKGVWWCQKCNPPNKKPETDFETELNRNGSYWKLWRVQNATINLLRNELKKQQLKWDQKENKYLQKIAKLEYMLYGEESEIQGRI